MAIAEWIVIRSFPLAALLGVLVGVVSPARAEGFRCPRSGKFVEVGDTMAEVEKKCGPPTSREDLFENACIKRRTCVTIKVGELWIYDFGRTFLTRQLRFQKIHLAHIEEGRYGTKPD